MPKASFCKHSSSSCSVPTSSSTDSLGVRVPVTLAHTWTYWKGIRQFHWQSTTASHFFRMESRTFLRKFVPAKFGWAVVEPSEKSEQLRGSICSKIVVGLDSMWSPARFHSSTAPAGEESLSIPALVLAGECMFGDENAWSMLCDWTSICPWMMQSYDAVLVAESIHTPEHLRFTR